MIVNEHFRFVFAHISKMAGTSLRTALGGLEGNTTLGVADTKHETPLEFPEKYEARTGVPPDRVRSYRFVCFVRHPVDRFASLHRYLITTHRHVYPQVPMSINRFAETVIEGAPWTRSIRAIQPQHVYTEGVAPWIGRFESLQEDFRTLTDLLEAPMTLEHLNASRTSSGTSAPRFSPKALLGRLKRARRSAHYVSEDLSPASRALIERYYAEDFARFGY